MPLALQGLIQLHCLGLALDLELAKGSEPVQPLKMAHAGQLRETARREYLSSGTERRAPSGGLRMYHLDQFAGHSQTSCGPIQSDISNARIVCSKATR